MTETGLWAHLMHETFCTKMIYSSVDCNSHTLCWRGHLSCTFASRASHSVLDTSSMPAYCRACKALGSRLRLLGQIRLRAWHKLDLP